MILKLISLSSDYLEIDTPKGDGNNASAPLAPPDTIDLEINTPKGDGNYVWYRYAVAVLLI